MNPDFTRYQVLPFIPDHLCREKENCSTTEVKVKALSPSFPAKGEGQSQGKPVVRQLPNRSKFRLPTHEP